MDAENISLLSRHNVMNPVEVESRYEIYVDTYNKQINIEALTMLDIAKKEILPAVMKYSDFIADNIIKLESVGGVAHPYQTGLLNKLSEKITRCGTAVEELENALKKASEKSNSKTVRAGIYRDSVIAGMKKLRTVCDEMEELTDKEYWPMPSYSDILFYL